MFRCTETCYRYRVLRDVPEMLHHVAASVSSIHTPPGSVAGSESAIFDLHRYLFKFDGKFMDLAEHVFMLQNFTEPY